MEISGKSALVTGGARRLGKAIALALARAGADVAVHYHASSGEAAATAAEIQALGRRAAALQADLTRPDEALALAARAQEALGQVDILVNSASFFTPTPFSGADFGLWKAVTAVLIDAPYLLAAALAPGMTARGEGAIVNILDLAAFEPMARFSAHAVGKAALLALTRQLALELAPAVRVNAVAPGWILPPEGYPAEKAARAARRVPLGRWGQPADVADAVVFLVQAPYITGEVLRVDGGARNL